MFKNSTQNSINYAEKLDESFKAIENEIFELEKLNF